MEIWNKSSNPIEHCCILPNRKVKHNSWLSLVSIESLTIAGSLKNDVRDRPRSKHNGNNWPRSWEILASIISAIRRAWAIIWKHFSAIVLTWKQLTATVERSSQSIIFSDPVRVRGVIMWKTRLNSFKYHITSLYEFLPGIWCTDELDPYAFLLLTSNSTLSPLLVLYVTNRWLSLKQQKSNTIQSNTVAIRSSGQLLFSMERAQG